MMDKSQQHELCRILVASLDQGATEDEFKKVDLLLSTDPEAVDFYIHFMKIYSRFAKPGKLFAENQLSREIDPVFDQELWKDLALNERQAPAISGMVPPEIQLIEKVERNKVVRQFNKTSLISIITAAAAVLCIILFARFSPVHHGVEVAILSDTINAEWAEINYPMVNGIRLETSFTPLTLKKGIAKIEFDNNAVLVIESPAQFELMAEDQVKLNYGKLYAVIPTEAVGFTVNTHNAKIIDLGTEFAVITDYDRTTELHVMKGETSLIAGDKNRKRFQVFTGMAKSIMGPDEIVQDIACNQLKFVRQINSADNLIWRGETEISLADIVGGGNGFGKLTSLTGLNPATGQYTSSVVENGRSSQKTYNLVPDSKFIDGVFVPDGGQNGRVIITSSNHAFQCPDTEGRFTHEIAVFTGDTVNNHRTIKPVIFNGQTYTSNPILMLHSNVGITFDLQAIRQSLPDFDLRHFKAFGGLTESLRNVRTGVPDIDFWVLVDGQIRYEKNALKLEDGSISFNIDLNPEDRFLTLIVTDGTASGGKRGYTPFNNDFFYLVDPRLCMADTSD